MYESKHSRFNEKRVYSDNSSKDAIINHDNSPDTVTDENFFDSIEPNTAETKLLEKFKGKEPKRKRGRPRKIRTDTEIIPKPVKDNSFEQIQILGPNLSDTKLMGNMLAHMNKDPVTYKDAMKSKERK